MAKEKDPNKLFDFINIMFTDRKKYDTLNPYIKAKHQFMINRFFSIKFPSQAQMFNKNGISGYGVVESWSFVAKRFNSVPRWFWQKTKSKNSKKKLKYTVNDEASIMFMRINKIGKREFEDLIKFNEKELNKILDNLQKQIETKDG
jgi:hypothetical protein